MKRALILGFIISLVATWTVLGVTKKLCLMLFRADVQTSTKLKNATVAIFTEEGARGSGFILKNPYKAGYLVVTNAHVCAVDTLNEEAIRSKSGMVTMSANYRISNEIIDFKATFKTADLNNDICLLDIRSYRGDSLEFAPEKIGGFDLVYLSTYHPQTNKFFTDVGYITSTLEAPSVFHQHSYLVTLFVIPGMSGSPLTDINGKVTGIVWGSSTTHRSTTFAVRREVIQELLKKDETKKL